jgi:hypothetical protein
MLKNLKEKLNHVVLVCSFLKKYEILETLFKQSHEY